MRFIPIRMGGTPAILVGMLRVLLTCVLAALLAPPLAAYGNDAWREDVWMADNGLNPCDSLYRRCDYFLWRIYDKIIDARQRGDAEGLEKWSRQLYWRNMSNPEDRPATE